MAENLILPPLPEWLESKLLAYQIKAARQILRALLNGRKEWGYPGAVDLSDVGTGKSFIDTAAALATGRAVVVLTVAAGIPGWLECFDHFGAQPHFIGTYEAVRGDFRPEIGSSGQRFFEWKNPEKIIIILDEAQKVKGDESLTTYTVGGAIAQGIPIIAASATMASTVTEMRIMGRITGLHRGGKDWLRFLSAMGAIYLQRENRWTWNAKKNRGHLDTIHHTLIPARGCRVRKDDMGARPKSTLRRLALRLPPTEAASLAKEYKDILEKAKGMEQARKENGSRKFGAEQVRNWKRGKLIKHWGKLEMVLVPQVVERAKECLQEGKAVIIFVRWSKTRLEFCKQLKTQDGFFGKQPLAKRLALKKAFQEGRIRTLVCNIAAAGAAMSLHDTTGDYPRETFIFTTDKPVELGQAPGRVDRAGVKTPSKQWLIYAANSYTEEITEKALARLENIRAFNDGEHARLL